MSHQKKDKSNLVVTFILMFTFISLFFSYPLHSQVKLGLQLGPNLANASTTATSFNIGTKTNFFGGILAEIKINDMFYIQPEVSLVAKGVDFELVERSVDYGFGNIIKQSGYIDYLVNYYEIPINLLAKFDVAGFTPFLFAGPSFNFFSAAKETYIGFYGDPEGEAADKFKKFDFAINFGGGIELPLSNSIGLFVNARYSLGLTNIYETLIVKEKIFLNEGFLSNTIIEEPLERFNTRGIIVSAGLKFAL